MTIILDLPPPTIDPPVVVSYSSFLSEVVPYAHDVPEMVALRAIKNACIEFCDKSMYWLYEVPPITLVSGTSTYDVVLPSGTVIARPLDGWVGNRKLTAKSEDQLRAIFMQDWRNTYGWPEYYTQMTSETITLVPTPQTEDIVDGINLIVALRPSRSAETVWDNLYERWGEQIAYGARARLYSTVGQPYYDPSAAQIYRGMFINAIGLAKIERNRGLTRATLAVRMPTAI